MLFDACSIPKKQGNIGLGAAISYFTRNGYTVSLPLNDSQDYDCVVDKDNVLRKVQVKTSKCRSKNGENYVVNLKVCGVNTKGSHLIKPGCAVIYDLLFVLCDDGRQFLIPKDVIKDIRSSICVGAKYAEYQVA